MRKTVLCLFFFCLCAAVGGGCVANDREKADSNFDEILVLTNGKPMLAETADYICEQMDAVHYELTTENKSAIKEAAEYCDYILIGTDRTPVEFEFSIRNCLEDTDMKAKKVSLFLVDQEEEQEHFEENIKEWYPEAIFLPTFSMSSDLQSISEEIGRINGWLTTVMTYHEIESEE